MLVKYIFRKPLQFYSAWMDLIKCGSTGYTGILRLNRSNVERKLKRDALFEAPLFVLHFADVT